MTFSLRPRSSSVLPEIAASVSTRVVSWNEAAEMKLSVDSDALVMPSSSGAPSAGVSVGVRSDFGGFFQYSVALQDKNGKELGFRAGFVFFNTGDNTLTVSLAGIRSNQGQNAVGDGNTSTDIVIDNGHIFLRAERTGTAQADRVYTITFMARDAAGNIGTGSATVTVPHDQRKLLPEMR